MASKTALNADTLKALGPDRLVGILLALAEEYADVKRRLRLELAAEAGGDVIASKVAKRLANLRTAKSFIDWQKRKSLVKDLGLQRDLILNRVAPTHPGEALDLLWQFLELARPVLDRVDDSGGTVGEVFRTAARELGALAEKARPDPVTFADRVFRAITSNDYGQYDHLTDTIVPALGASGVAHLRNLLTSVLAKRQGDWRAAALRRALQALADGEGDVDAYIALVPRQDRTRPGMAANIGRRLLEAGRTAEALATLEAARPRRIGADDEAAADLELYGLTSGDADWEEVYLRTLDALGETARSQQIRWAAFETRLSVGRLREYLKMLPDFDDVEATHRAMAHAAGFRYLSMALHFFREWPALDRAADLIIARHAELDGNLYFLFDGAARWLEGKYPLAASLLRRAMIDDTLGGAKSSRYRHAARHLLECDALAPAIDDFGTFETHQVFLKRLKTQHGRKAGFWSRYDELAGKG